MTSIHVHMSKPRRFAWAGVSSLLMVVACGHSSGSGGPASAAGGYGASGGGSASTTAAGESGTLIAGAGAGPTSAGGNGAAAGGGRASAGSAGDSTESAGASGAGVIISGDQVRNVMPFDSGWRFNKGDVSGAEQVSFADAAWRALSVPHDWSIEGPFDQNATTTGRGGYLPSGVGWYRKHFTLPQALSGKQVFIEFDGVMANSDVYINGTHLGNRPYGYVGFRYDMTSSVKFGSADNVLAIKCDNSVQPASRYYTGAGIYRHVRLIATDPVHIDQWATYITTPQPTATAATVHVTTSVVNQGTAAQTLTVQGIVNDPSGTALAPVTTAAQGIAPGKSAAFSFDVAVPHPLLWEPAAPNLYSLTTKVQVGASSVDDEVTAFGIRSIVFDPASGMSINGKNTKLKGVAIHEEISGLGVAVPERAWQRRLAQFKSLGVNAIRTSHNPFPPEFLDLTDRMGILVMDEFFDVWAAKKYSDVGDYSAYFAKTAPAITGSPAVPAAIAGGAATWWQTDITDIVMHDRNHPSVAIYSTGNEIRDSIASRTPLLTRMVALCHQLDPARSVTQALFDPDTAGDTTGATRTILDVWGNNYNVASCLTAMAASPPRAGIMTEIGHETSTWDTVTKTPSLAGEFIWAGADYLGEAPLGWPTVGSTQGLLDRMGTIKADGYTWQKLWGTPSSPPATGTSASKVILNADHASLLNDPNDVVYVKATIADTSGNAVTSSSAPVTFAITGPGSIVAVDSGSPTQESFRGNVRKAYNGVCFAIVQATGPGTITVTATSSGLTDGTATVQASAGTFAPCSGSCD